MKGGCRLLLLVSLSPALHAGEGPCVPGAPSTAAGCPSRSPSAHHLEVGGADGGHRLGRLFTTPAERRVIGEATAAPAPRLEGVVRRPDGASVVWIDGHRLRPGDPLPDGGRVVAVEGGRVVVEWAGRRAAPRVGERLVVEGVGR